MSSVRTFAGFGSLARFLEKQSVVAVPLGELAIADTARLLLRATKHEYGDRVLADLAEATQIERAQLGYTPDRPLLRDGQLLRDSVEMEVGPDFAAVHTDELVAGYSEFGFLNARTGTTVPPRPAFRIALEHCATGIVALLEGYVGRALGFGMGAVSSNIATGTTSYKAEIR